VVLIREYALLPPKQQAVLESTFVEITRKPMQTYYCTEDLGRKVGDNNNSLVHTFGIAFTRSVFGASKSDQYKAVVFKVFVVACFSGRWCPFGRPLSPLGNGKIHSL